jgi:hypothetical protein
MYGIQNKDELVYVLMCEKCGKVLGEWPTVEEPDVKKAVGCTKSHATFPSF